MPLCYYMNSMRRVDSWLRRFIRNIYLPGIVAGMLVTMYKFIFVRRVTLQYPEEKLPVPKGFRGEHRLKKDELGRPKCVACFMCATACPSNCIHIEAGESPWPDREKIPVKFDIDMLKCIYCGMCEEACPCDAIELTQKYYTCSTTREEKVYDITKLLNN